MLTRAQYLTLHGQFYDAFVNSSFSTDRYLDYNEFSILSESSMGGRWLIFHTMAKDLVRELLNTINGYYTNLRKLESWNLVLAQCDDEYRNDFIVEILNPAASITVNYVSVLKQRTIYAACMLSHQTSMLLDTSIQDNSLVEHRICLNTLRNYQNIFNHISPLMEALNRIDNQSFRQNTLNFRNLYQHRIPPRFELGRTGLINRIVSQNGDVSYGIGGRPPLEIRELIPILHEQHHESIQAFQLFWHLITEQVSLWQREAPNAT
jgi:hypothetical protein